MMAMLMMMNPVVQPAEAAQITNYLAAGNYSFLEREYQDLTLAGVSLVDVGTCDGKQCVKVTYDDEKVPFERIMRVYFKHFDPKNASKGQYWKSASNIARGVRQLGERKDVRER